MSMKLRKSILRANAIFLLVAGTGGLVSDLRGAFLLQGPVGLVVEAAPHTAIGFVEAHGLALIIGVLLWRAPPDRMWHLTAMAVHLLLGASNLVFWPLFGFADMMAVGYITTALHGLFALLQLGAALAVPARVFKPS